VGATFGRSFYVLDDYTPLRDVNTSMLKNDTVLFPVRKAHWYVPRRPLGCGEPGCAGSQGDGYFIAPNPDFGATFTYYLPETIQTSQEARREAEKEREDENQSVVFAPWDTVLKEQREDEPAIVFTVTNRNGSVVRQIEGPVEAGFHRVSWDLRYPELQAWIPEDEREDGGRGSGGVLVVPGTFSVAIHKRVDGVLTDLGQHQSFDVVSIREPTLPGSTQEQRVVFETQIDELIRASDGTVKAIDEIVLELDAVKEVLERSTADASMYEIANSIQQRATVQRERLRGNETRGMFKDLGEVPLSDRVWHARFDPSSGAYGPTPEQRESLQIGRELFDDVTQQLSSLIDDEYAGLKEALDAARVPWTPGRGLQ
jgi:hypothetical protein